MKMGKRIKCITRHNYRETKCRSSTRHYSALKTFCLYDAFNRLIEIRDSNGKRLQRNFYDYTGNRIKQIRHDGTRVYTFAGYYQITIPRGREALHTKFIYGINGDLATQITKRSSQVRLLSSAYNGGFLFDRGYGGTGLLKYVSLALLSIEAFMLDAANIRYYKIGILFAVVIFMLLGLILGIKHGGMLPTFSRIIAIPIVMIFASVMLLTGCDNTSPPRNDPICEEENGGGNGGNDTGNDDNEEDENLPYFDPRGLPRLGIFYFHPDHLGSTAFITDVGGNIVTRIHYKPYGEVVTPIDRNRDIFGHKFTSQVDDGSVTGLMYYKARFYKPSIGRFITPDTIVPYPDNVHAFNRYMYVAGNPISFVDPTGNSWQSVKAGLKKAALVTLQVGTIVALFTVFAVVAPSLPAGWVIGMAIFTYFMTVNILLGMAYNIYSNDWKGILAFYLDHSIALPITFAGQLFMIYLLESGARLNGDLSKHSNAFIFDNAKLGRGNYGVAVGNIAGMNTKEIERDGEDYFRILREELAHNWQYRIGGIFAAIKLIQEQIFEACGIYDPYKSRGNLERAARSQSLRESDNRPWFLRGDNFDKFFP